MNKMTYEQESQLADFSKAISFTVANHPHLKVVEVIDHAWTMTKKLYSYLTVKDKKLFLLHIDTSKLPA